ncbi:hypothetical protein GCK32_011185 [Trichostrongylus colubriformis]|uniref:AMP-dependent synthetase/ligase domain-containing protein n=1 Tax=Trichostrongylus colubriformis TaxID=6319 RepID=A0AAN8FXX7_TRICO
MISAYKSTYRQGSSFIFAPKREMSVRLICRIRSALTAINPTALVHVRGVTSRAAFVPTSNVPLHKKVIEAVRNHAQNPGRIALINADGEEQNLTYKALLYQTEAAASYLCKEGFTKGDVACFVMSNSTAFVVSHLGVMRSGGVVTTASPFTSLAALEHQLRDSKASLVFTDESILPRVMLAVNECSNVKKIICVRSTTSSADLPEGVVDFKTLIRGPVDEFETHNKQRSFELTEPGSPRRNLMSQTVHVLGGLSRSHAISDICSSDLAILPYTYTSSFLMVLRKALKSPKAVHDAMITSIADKAIHDSEIGGKVAK